MDQETTEYLLTSGAQDNTAAAGEHVEATQTAPAEGTQTTDAPEPEGVHRTSMTGERAEGEKEGDKPTGAPEQYEAFNVPEGYALDEQMLEEFTPVLKELNLPQEAAQKVIDFAPKLIERTVAQTQVAVLTQLGLEGHQQWAAQAKADKEYGGDKFAENLAAASKALTTFGSPELIGVLKKTGLANHPEVIRAFVKVGKQISEDGYVAGGTTRTPQNTALSLFDQSNMNP